ncbi:amidohydrolase family protein [Thermodesulfobacteriota bacterium]
MRDSDLEIIDVFTHISPKKYDEALYKKASYTFHKEHNAGFPALVDLDARFRIMDKFEGLKQVLTIAQPPLETVVDTEDAVVLARLANDEMAELVERHPDRFVAAAACLPMNDVDAAIMEADRAIRDLKFKGVQIYTPVGQKPLDRPEFMPLYELMSKNELPIWIHPTLEPSVPDYADETESKYDLFRSIGWPYESSKGMARLVFSGVFDKYPNLKFIIHHCGAMVPFFASRLCSMTRDWLQKPSEEYFKMFYVDTATIGNKAGLTCGHAFYGDDHMVFGTDMPVVGGINIERGIKVIESLDISRTAKQKIYAGNAKKLLNLPKK